MPAALLAPLLSPYPTPVLWAGNSLRKLHLVILPLRCLPTLQALNQQIWHRLVSSFKTFPSTYSYTEAQDRHRHTTLTPFCETILDVPCLREEKQGMRDSVCLTQSWGLVAVAVWLQDKAHHKFGDPVALLQLFLHSTHNRWTCIISQRSSWPN